MVSMVFESQKQKLTSLQMFEEEEEEEEDIYHEKQTEMGGGWEGRENYEVAKKNFYGWEQKQIHCNGQHENWMKTKRYTETEEERRRKWKEFVRMQ